MFLLFVIKKVTILQKLSYFYARLTLCVRFLERQDVLLSNGTNRICF